MDDLVYFAPVPTLAHIGDTFDDGLHEANLSPDGVAGGLVLSPRVALDSDLRNRTYKALHLGDYTSTGPTGTGTRDPAARAAAGRGPESRTSSDVFAAAIADAGLRQ